MLLLAHYQLGNMILVDNLLPTTNRFFKSNNETNPVQLACMKFLKKASKGNTNLTSDVEALIDELNKYIENVLTRKTLGKKIVRNEKT